MPCLTDASLSCAGSLCFCVLTGYIQLIPISAVPVATIVDKSSLGKCLVQPSTLEPEFFFSVLPPCKLDFRPQIRFFFPCALRPQSSTLKTDYFPCVIKPSQMRLVITGHSFVVLSCMCYYWFVALGVNFTTDVISIIVEEVPVPENTVCRTCLGQP